MDTVELTANGKTYTLRPLGTNELVALEERLGKNFGAIMQEIGAFGMEHLRLSTVRVFLQTCLTEPATEDEIGLLIDTLRFDGIAAAINGLILPAREVAA